MSDINNHTDNFTLFYDGACPLCRKEVAWLQRRCIQKGYRLSFVDISTPEFSPESTGKSLSTLMQSLHLQGPSGEWWTAMEATRIIYQRIGLGWLMAPTGWPLLKPLFDTLYRSFAKVRPRLQKNACNRCIR